MIFIAGLLIPASLLVCCVFGAIQGNLMQQQEQQREKSQTDSGKLSWRFSERTPSSSSRQTTPLKLRAASPLSESSTSSKLPVHVKRKYDGVYRTHEPLPGKPDIEFEDKEWDLTLNEEETNSPAISTASSSRKTPSTPIAVALTASPSPTVMQRPPPPPLQTFDPQIYKHSSEV